MKKRLAFSLLCCCILYVSSQNRITQPNPVLRYDTRYVTLGEERLRRVDSTVRDYHRYNITERQAVPYYNIGNFGTAYYPLLFEFDRQAGFQHGFNSFDLYTIRPPQLRFYNTKTPYTMLDFIFGGKEEVIGGVDFALNITPNANIGFSYHRNNFKGQLANQLSVHNTMSIRHWLRTKRNTYDLKFAVVYNQVKNEENGGWAIDNVFGNSLYDNRFEFVPTQLESALNNWKNARLLAVQTIHLGPKETVRVNDSVSQERVVPRFAIEHTMDFDNRNIVFKDYAEDSAFYDNVYYDTDSTTDETHTWNFSNRLLFRNVQRDPAGRKPQYAIGLSYGLIRYQQYSTDEFVHDLQALAMLYNDEDSAFFHYKVNVATAMGAKYIGTFRAEADMRLNFKNSISVGIDAVVSQTEPTRKEEQYLSNHFTWDNDFNRIFSAKAGFSFNWEKQRLFAGLSNQFVQNLVYFDTAALPRQLTRPVNILQAHIRKDFDLRFLFFGTDIYVQWISNTDILRLPAFFVKQTVCYQGGWISGKLNARLGFDIFYNTKFRGNAYQPATAMFHHQDTETLTFYPVLDLFFSMNVKHTNVFLRWEHVDQGLFNQKGIYTAPDYPYLNRTFRVGVIWQFYD